MKYKELETLKADDLEKKEVEVKMELMKLQAEAATGTNPKSPGKIRQLKKINARIATIKTKQSKEVMEKDARN